MKNGKYIEGHVEFWYNNDKVHRDEKDPDTGETLPAVIFPDGSKRWYYHGKRHRDDKDKNTGETLPAAVSSDGSKRWYYHGNLHRTDKDLETGYTLPAVITSDGSKRWYYHGKRHRDDTDINTGAPMSASIWSNGDQFWYKDDKCHNTKGLPAVSGNNDKEWYFKGKRVTEEENIKLWKRSVAYLIPFLEYYGLDNYSLEEFFVRLAYKH